MILPNVYAINCGCWLNKPTKLVASQFRRIPSLAVTMTDFLPKDYKIPVDSNWMKLTDGENRFRILGSAIVGTEYWVAEEGKNKPVRVKPNTTIPMEKVLTSPKTGKLNISHFWMFPVWNYGAKKVQVLEITQKTIMKAIRDLIDNPKWGTPEEYDIVVTKGLVNGKVAYTTMPDPKEPIPPEAQEMFKKINLNLEAVWEGKDPFKPDEIGTISTPVTGENVSPDEIPF